MDDRRFDDMVRVLAHGETSRRATLFALAGASLGGLSVGNCSPQSDICVTGDPRLSACGEAAICTATTGNAPFCAGVIGIDPEDHCRPCARDVDCEDQGFPVGSACVALVSGACGDHNICVGINGSNGTACLPPGA